MKKEKPNEKQAEYQWATLNGRPLDDEERRRAATSWRIFMESEPVDDVITINLKPFLVWLLVKIQALVSLMKLQGVSFRDENAFIDKMFQDGSLYIQGQLENALSNSIQFAVDNWHTHIFAVVGELSGISDKDVARLLPTRKQVRESFNAVFAETLEGIPAQVGRGGNRRSKADLSHLREHYDSVIEDWREASLMYTEACASRSPQRKQKWQQSIQEAFPELPPRLIARLRPKHDWSSDIIQEMGNKGGGSKPEDIAAEHAAQLCDANPYEYPLATLRDYLKPSRTNRKGQKQAR